MSLTRSISKLLLAIFMIGAGIMHFVNPGFFEDHAAMPSSSFWIGHGQWRLRNCSGRTVAGSTVIAIGGMGNGGTSDRRIPTNIYLYQNKNLMPASPLVHFLRLPSQGVFILWAYWHTRISDNDSTPQLNTTKETR